MLGAKRLSKQDRSETLGTFKPVGYVVIALPDDEQADAALKAFREAGFGDEDLITYTSAEAQERMEDMLQHSSDFAGFGYEVTLMRRYQELCREGAGWVMVYAPQEARALKAAEIASSFGALMAVHYHTLVVEDLI